MLQVMSDTEMEDSPQEVVGYYSTIENGKEIIFEVHKGDQMPDIVRQNAENRFPHINLSNNEIDPMQCVDINEDIISEDEEICQMEGNNVETNETIQCKKHNDTKLHKVKARKGLRTPQPDIETNPLDESDLVELPNIIQRETLDNSHKSDSLETNPLDEPNLVELPNIIERETLDNLHKSDSLETEENLTDSRTNLQFTLDKDFNCIINNNYQVKVQKGIRIPQHEVERDPGYQLEESDVAKLPNITQRETLDNLHEIDSKTNAHTYAFTLQEYFDYKQNTKNKAKVKNGIRTPQSKIRPPKEYLLDGITDSETSEDSDESDSSETEENPTDSRTNVQNTLEDNFNYKINNNNQVIIRREIRIPEHKTETNSEYLLNESDLVETPNITESETSDDSHESDSIETEENPTDSRAFENNFSHKINNYNQVNFRKGLRIPEHETESNLECLLDESGLELPNITESGTLENLQESDSTETEENLTDSRSNEQFTLKDNFNYEINTNNQVKGIRIPQLEVGTDPGYLLDETNQEELPIITQRETLDNSHESDCISSEILSQGKESSQISKEDFFNNLVVKFVQRYVNEARAKGFKISTNESTDENASSADEGLMDMEEDFVSKINEYLENFVDGTEFNNEINTMQCVDTNKDIISEDEGICQMEGNNVETNETIQGILQPSEESYIDKNNEKEIYIIGKKGCVDDTEDVPNVGKVAVHQISADTDEENLLPSMCLLVEQNNEKGKMDTGDFVDGNTFRTDKMEIDEKHVEENYVQENLPVVIRVVKGKETIYSILYKSPWEIAYLDGEEISISKVLCVKLSKECGTKKLRHFKAFILAQKDTSSKEQEKVYNITKFVKLSKKQEKISACKANEAKIKMNKKSQKKSMLRTMKKLFSSSANKNKLKIKRLPKRKFFNVADYFIEEQISKLCFDSHRAEKLEYIYEQEYNPEDYKYPKANRIKCVWHETIIGKKNSLSHIVDKNNILDHFIIRKSRNAKAASQSQEIVVPVREKVVPLKNPKKLSVLKQVLEDLKKKELLKKHGISGLPTKDGNVKKKNNKRKVASTNEPKLEKRKKEITNPDNSSNQNLSLKHKLMNIINKVIKRTKKLKNKKHSKERNKSGPIKRSTVVPYYSKIFIKKINDGSYKIISKDNMKKPKLNKHNTIAKPPKIGKAIKKTRQEEEVIKHIGSGQQAKESKTAVKGPKKKKVVKEATKREEAIKEIGIGQQSEQLKTKGPKKRKAVEEAKEIEETQKKMGIWQQSKQPKTTANSLKKRKAGEKAKERKEAQKEIGILQQSKQPKTTTKGSKKRKADEEAKEREEAQTEIGISQQSKHPKTTAKSPKKRKADEEAKEREYLSRMTERQFLIKQKK